MKNLKIMSLLIIMSFGVLPISNGMEPEHSKKQNQNASTSDFPKCVSKRGNTLWDMLMKAEDSCFDDIINYMYKRDPSDLAILTPQGLIVNSVIPGLSSTEDDWSRHCDSNDKFILDVYNRDVIEILLFSAIQRNIPTFISLIFQANDDLKIDLQQLTIECLSEAVVLCRLAIINIFLENITPCDEYYHAIDIGLNLAQGMLNPSDLKMLQEFSSLVSFFEKCACSCSQSQSDSQ